MDPTDKAGLLYGVPAIAAFLDLPEKAVRHRIEAGLVPTFKVGGIICATRDGIRGWLADCAAKAAAERQA